MQRLGLRLSITGNPAINGGGPPPVPPLDPDVALYTANIAVAGGSLNGTELAALIDLVEGLKADLLWPLARRINPMLGSVLACAGVVLNASVGAAADTLNNYVGGDWNRVSGLQGNGTNTYMDTGYLPSELTGFFGVCFRGTSISGTTRYLGGVISSGSNEIALGWSSASSGKPRGYWGGLTIAEVTSGVPLPPSIYAINREGPTDLRLLQDNVSIATSATSTVPDVSTFPLIVGGYNVLGTPSSLLTAGQRIAGYMVFEGLNATQRGNLQTRWAAFNTALGR